MAYAKSIALAFDARPELAAEMADMGMNRELIRRLELLGRKQIDERLLFETSCGGRKLIGLSITEQGQALSNGIEVLDMDEENTRNIPVRDLTPKQVTQVFHGANIRSIAEQRTFIRELKRNNAPIVHEDYRVQKDKVTTYRAGVWTKKMVLQWLTEMG